MVRIILSIIFIIVIVLFVSFNVRNTTSLSFFGRPIEDVSVVSVALISFVIGILYSFIFYVASYFSKLRRGRLKAQEQLTRIKGKEIKEKEKKLEKSGQQQAAASERAPAGKGDKSGGITSVFSRKGKAKDQEPPAPESPAPKPGKKK
jgi:uncharacterized integral membrane protein